jgi:hypothetical protein
MHNPQRRDGESFKSYRERRQASQQAVREMTRDPNHGLVGARKQYRDEMRKSGAMGKRVRACDALMAAWASKRVTKAALRDENGAYTCVGAVYEVEGMAPDTTREHVISSWVHGEDMGYTARRKWLAGISAQA